MYLWITFTIQHGMFCKKREFVNILHNNVIDLAAKPLSEVCHDVQAGPTFLPLTGEQMDHCTAINTNKAMLDIRAGGFWIQGQQAFLNVTALNLNAC